MAHIQLKVYAYIKTDSPLSQITKRNSQKMHLISIKARETPGTPSPSAQNKITVNKKKTNSPNGVGRWRRTGSTWPWCWTGCSCGSSPWQCWWARPASSCRRLRSTTTASPWTRSSARWSDLILPITNHAPRLRSASRDCFVFAWSEVPMRIFHQGCHSVIKIIIIIFFFQRFFFFWYSNALLCEIIFLCFYI